MKRGLRFGAGALALCLALLVAVLALPFHPAGLNWLVQQGQNLSGGRLQVRGLSGDIRGPLRLESLTLALPDQRIRVQGLSLTWRLGDLWDRSLHVTRLHIARLEIETLKPSEKPMPVPQSLALPVSVRIDVAELGTLVLIRPGGTQTYTDGRLKLADDGVYRLVLENLESPWGRLEGRLDLNKRSPFALHGNLSGTRKDPVPMTLQAQATGSLLEPLITANADGGGLRLKAYVTLAPFTSLPVKRAVIAAESLNPRSLSPDAPQASLNLAGQFSSTPQGGLLGQLAVDNDIPGPLDQGRLPVSVVRAVVAGDGLGVTLNQLEIDLGRAGQLQGNGRWLAGRADFELTSPGINLKAIDSRLAASRLGARLHLTGDHLEQVLALKLVEGSDVLEGSIRHKANALILDSLKGQLRTARLQAQGRYGLTTEGRFALNGRVDSVNPAHFGKFPSGNLNAAIQLDGRRKPGLMVQGSVQLDRGQLQGRPVIGHASGGWQNGHLSGIDADLLLAGNRLKMKGAYGNVQDRLTWDIDAPHLENLGFKLKGSLRSSGSLQGRLDNPDLNLTAQARQLQLFGGIRADALDLSARLQPGGTGQAWAEWTARQVSWADLQFESLAGQLRGTRARHELEVRVRQARGNVEATLHGALADNWQWDGWLDSLHGRLAGSTPLNVSLRAPARLGLSARRQYLQAARVEVNAAEVNIDDLQIEGKHFRSKGSVQRLPWAALAPFLPPALPFESDLVVNGDWDMSLDPALNGRLRLARVSGDVSVKDPHQTLQLKSFTLALDAKQGQVDAKLAIDSDQAGQVDLNGRMQLSSEPFNTVWRQAPLAAKGTARLPNLLLLRPWLPPGMLIDARAEAAFEAAGTWERPEVNGSLNLDKLRVRLSDPGVKIVDGELALTLKDRIIRVDKGLIKGQDGQIKLSGSADLDRDDAHLQLQFERFAALLQSGARMWISGPADLTLQKRRLGLSGTLKVDRARIEELAGSRPRLSDDVVIKGAPTAKAKGNLAFPLDMAVSLDLGQDFQFRGYGFDGKLDGVLTFRSRAPEPLQATGAIRVVEGDYVAYGQKLKVSQGTVSFIGPLNNPGLDMLAVRETGDVTAGVQVAGTARNPRVTLYSKPDMPDAEKLSWLVFGHGLSKVGEQQFGLLQVAASALLSRGQSSNLQRDIANRLGIDSFDVRSGTGEDVASTVVSVGKRLSSRATLSYDQSLDGLQQLVKVIYQLKPGIRFEATTGSQSGFDAFYSHDFE